MYRILFIFSFVISVQLFSCVSFPCDKSIQYAMQRYGDKTMLRLKQYRQTIHALTSSEALFKKILVVQNSELDKSISRAMIENMDVSHINHLSAGEKHLSKRYNIQTNTNIGTSR